MTQGPAQQSGKLPTPVSSSQRGPSTALSTTLSYYQTPTPALLFLSISLALPFLSTSFMYAVNIFFDGEGVVQHFNMQYYTETFMPTAAKLWCEHGLLSWQVFDLRNETGSTVHLHRVHAIMYWSSKEKFVEAFAKGYLRELLFDDISSFSTVPAILIPGVLVAQGAPIVEEKGMSACNEYPFQKCLSMSNYRSDLI